MAHLERHLTKDDGTEEASPAAVTHEATTPETEYSGIYFEPLPTSEEEPVNKSVETAETIRLNKRIDEQQAEIERLTKKIFSLQHRIGRQDRTLGEDEKLIESQANKIIRLENRTETLTEQNTELTEENRLLSIQNRNLVQTKASREDVENLTAKLDTFEGPKDRQNIIRLNRANFVQEKAIQYGGNLQAARIQAYSFPGGIETSSLPSRIAVRLPVQPHWLKKFFSDEALHFVNILEWRFCGIDERGMAHYACLLDELTEVNAQDWHKIISSGGAMSATVKLQLKSRDKWIISERGINYHLENYRVSKMEHHPDESVRNILAKSFTTPIS